ncbi:MAG: type II secretion system protein [Phycisphaerae bacterium]
MEATKHSYLARSRGAGGSGRSGGGARRCRETAKSRRPAFTLIELLAVVAIIALLISILVPSLRTAREMARKAVCSVHLRSMAGSLSMYAGDNNEIVSATYWFWRVHRDSSWKEWSWSWPDPLVKYFDTDARPSTNVPPDLSAQAGYCSVGVQPADNVYSRNVWGVPIAYSRRMNCASQENKGGFHYTWVKGLTWGYNPNLSDQEKTYSWYTPHKLSEFKRVQQYCQITEPDAAAPDGSGWLSTSMTQTSEITNLAIRVPHLKMSNGAMLDGHVETFPQKLFFDYYNGQSNSLYYTQAYPFYPR